VPPTTLSGYLLRLLRLSKGQKLPREAIFKNEEPDIKHYNILELPNFRICALGAYPQLSSKFTSYRMGYQTLDKGHGLGDGIDIFDPTVKQLVKLVDQGITQGILNKEDKEKLSKQISRSENDKLYIRSVYRRLLLGVNRIPTYSSFKRESRRQPLNWEFLITPCLKGYVVSSSENPLKELQGIKNYGYKLGKEGFAYVESIEGPYKLDERSGTFESSVVFPVEANSNRLIGSARLVNLYYFDFNENRFRRGFFALPRCQAKGAYYETKTEYEENYVIPRETIKIFSGGNFG